MVAFVGLNSSGVKVGTKAGGVSLGEHAVHQFIIFIIIIFLE